MQNSVPADRVLASSDSGVRAICSVMKHDGPGGLDESVVIERNPLAPAFLPDQILVSFGSRLNYLVRNSRQSLVPGDLLPGSLLPLRVGPPERGLESIWIIDGNDLCHPFGADRSPCSGVCGVSFQLHKSAVDNSGNDPAVLLAYPTGTVFLLFPGSGAA